MDICWCKSVANSVTTVQSCFSVKPPLIVLCVCRKKDMKDKLVNQWISEDFEWPRSNSSKDTYHAGKFTMYFIMCLAPFKPPYFY